MTTTVERHDITTRRASKRVDTRYRSHARSVETPSRLLRPSRYAQELEEGPADGHTKPIAAVRITQYRRERSLLGRFVEDFGLEKSFTVFSFMVATTLMVFSVADLVIGWPWLQVSRLFDAIFLSCALMLFWSTYDVFRDQVRVNR